MHKGMILRVLAFVVLCLLPSTASAAPGSTELSPGVPVSGNLAGSGSEAAYQVTVTAGQHLFVALDSANSAASSALYIKYGALPSTTDYDDKGDLPRSDQAVEIASTQVGTYYILVRSTSGGWDYSIVAHTSDTFPALSPGTTQAGTLADVYDARFYQVTVSAGEHLSVVLDSGGNAAYAELYIKYGALPSTTDYEDKGDLPRSDQAVEIANTQAGTYYVLMRSTLSGWSYSIVAHTAATFPTLALGSAQSGTLTDVYDARWYQVTVSAGEHLIVVLDSDSNAASGELYIRYGALPSTTAGTYDDKGDLPRADQAVEIASTQVGTYYVLVRSTLNGWSYSITAHTGATFPTLALGTAQSGTLTDIYDARWYQVTVSAGQHLFVVLDSASNAAYGELYVRYGALPSTTSYDDKGDLPRADQAVEIASTQSGTYYVLVRSTLSGWRFSITAHTSATFPTLVLGTPQSGTLADVYDARWYQVTVAAGRHLYVMLDSANDSCSSGLFVKYGALPSTTDYDATGGSSRADQTAEVASTQAGTYYVLVRSTLGGWGYSIAAYDDDTLPSIAPLTLGVTQEITVTSGSSAWFRMDVVTGTANLFLTLQKHRSWGSQLGLTGGGATVASTSTSYDDQVLHVSSPAPGRYLLQVSGTGTGRLTAYAALPELALGEWKVGTIYRSYGSAWYQFTVPSGQSAVYLNVETLGLWSQLHVYSGTLDIAPGWSASGYTMTLAIPSPAPGTYFAHLTDSAWVDGTDQKRDHMIRAGTTSASSPACAAPTISGFSPAQGGTDGTVTVRVSGQCLTSGSTVCLTRAGSGDVCATTVSAGDNTRTLAATFDLSTAAAGSWNLVVSTPSIGSATAAEQFTVESDGEASLWVDIVGRSQLRVGRWSTYVVRYGNRGTVDANFAHIALSAPAQLGMDVDLPWQMVDESGSWPGDSTDPEQLYATLIYLSSVPAGSEGQFEMRLLSNAEADDLSLKAAITTDPSGYLTAMPDDPLAFLGVQGQSSSGPAAAELPSRWAISPHPERDCSANPNPGYILVWQHKGIFRWHVAKSIGGGEYVEMGLDGIKIASVSAELSGGCTSQYLGAYRPPWWSEADAQRVQAAGQRIKTLLAEGMISNEYNRANRGSICDSAFTPLNLQTNTPAYIKTNCLGLVEFLNPEFETYRGKVDVPFGWPATVPFPNVTKSDAGTVSTGDPCRKAFANGDALMTLKSITSISPEDKVGPTGYDAPGTAAGELKHWVPADQALDYRVDFWNKPDAAAATVDVVISDTLDANLDWTTFKFTQVGFLDWTVPIEPGQYFNVDVPNVAIDLSRYFTGQPVVTMTVNVEGTFDPATGLIRWEFHALDPATREPPENPYAGFLPPITDSGREIGWVDFSVTPKNGLASGTGIGNQAFVKFDVDAFKPAPAAGPFVNTLDAAAPASAVSSPAGTQKCASFPVAWSGSDDANGAGVSGYDVYVDDLADAGGAYLWQDHTTALSATFTGVPGHRYRFYTRARDNVGRVEAAPAASGYDVEATAGNVCLYLPQALKNTP